MPMEYETTTTPRGAQLHPRSHQITFLDTTGQLRKLDTEGVLLVMDPQLAAQCEALDLEYLYLNPRAVVWVSVKTRAEAVDSPNGAILAAEVD